MKRILVMGALFFIFGATSAFADQKENLQEQIDALPSGGTLLLDDRVYNESIQLSRPIILEGRSKTTISYCLDEPVIKITGTNVTVKNIKIESCSNEDGIAAIEVEGTHHKLEKLKINTMQYGITLDEAYQSTITEVEITGQKDKNGIDLWNSSENSILNTTIQNVYDGIYLENSNENKLWNNRVTNARYGYHLMFSNQNYLKGNHSSRNSTGAMIMDTKDTIIEKNEFLSNNENVHAQGLLLYDTFRVKVMDNIISQNRVGLFFDNAQQNILMDNVISQNFIGMQMKEFYENTLINNSLVGNVYDSQAISSKDNLISNNYWDSALKLDIAGNGNSIIPYLSDPYFLSITSTTPEYQLFFHSPGMLVLQRLLKSEEDILLKDDSPRMEPAKTWIVEKETNSLLWWVSLCMVLISLTLLLKGRKKL